MTIDRCEESVLYMKEWSEKQKWDINFDVIEQRCCRTGTERELFRLIEDNIHPSRSGKESQDEDIQMEF